MTAALAVIAAVALLAAAALAALALRPHLTVRVRDGVITVRTERGKVVARPVVHDDLGRVYEVRSRLRGEGRRTTYVPPAERLVVEHVRRRVERARAER